MLYEVNFFKYICMLEFTIPALLMNINDVTWH